MTDEQIREWTGLAYGIARSYFLPGADVEDTRQEALIGLVKGLRDYNPAYGRLRPFLSMCIHRQLVTAVKRHRRLRANVLTFSSRQGVSEDGSVATITELAECPRGSTEDVVMRRADLQGFLDTVNDDLTASERAALLGYLSGETYLESANRLARSAKSIDNALTRTRRKVTERLAA